MKLTVTGVGDAQKSLERVRQGAASMRGTSAVIGSRLPYAWGIERGRHRKSGRLARRRGGAFYLENAVKTVVSAGSADIGEGLRKVTKPGVWIYRRLGRWVRRLSRANVPVRTRKLKRSIRVEMRNGS